MTKIAFKTILSLTSKNQKQQKMNQTTKYENKYYKFVQNLFPFSFQKKVK